MEKKQHIPKPETQILLSILKESQMEDALVKEKSTWGIFCKGNKGMEEKKEWGVEGIHIQGGNMEKVPLFYSKIKEYVKDHKESSKILANLPLERGLSAGERFQKILGLECLTESSPKEIDVQPETVNAIVI